MIYIGTNLVRILNDVADLVRPMVHGTLYLVHGTVIHGTIVHGTLSGRTGSALVCHTQGRVFAPRLLQQVLRFVARIYTVQYVELGGYCPV